MTEEIIRRPLGPNDGSSADGTVYEYQAWPAWRYDPDTGQGQIFESAEEVPLGWTNIPPGTTPPGEDAAPVVDETKLEGVVVQGGGEAGQAGVDGAADGSGGEGGSDDDDDDDDDDDAGNGGVNDSGGSVLLPEWTKDELVALGQAKLVEILEAKNGGRKANNEDEIEFLPNWSKKKLADTILENGGYRAAKEA